jgi:hypothetical protein
MAHDPNPFVAADQYGAEMKHEKEAEKKTAETQSQLKQDALNAEKRHEESKRRGMI